MLSTKSLVRIALAGAIAFIAMRLTSIPIFPGAPYLKLELSEFIVLLVGCIMTPVCGLLVLLIKDLLFWILGGVGILSILADFVAMGTLTVGFCTLYHKYKGKKGIILGAFTGIILRCLIVVPVNLIVLKLEQGMPAEKIIGLLIPFIIPFNVIKSIVNIMVLVIVSKLIHKEIVKIGDINNERN